MSAPDFPDLDDLPPLEPGTVPVGYIERCHQGDPIDLADFEVRADEVRCGACFLVHRPGRCDR